MPFNSGAVACPKLGKRPATMKGSIGKLFKHSLFPIFLSLLSLLFASVINSSVSFLTVAIFALICCFQILTAKLSKIDFRIAGLEIQKEKRFRKSHSYSYKLSLVSSIVPFLVALTPSYVGIIVFAVYVILSVYYFAPLVHRIANRKCIREYAINRIKNERPVIAVYVTGMQGVAYQINQWLPVLEKLEQRVIIVVRESDIYLGMLPTNITVISARTQLDLEVIFGQPTSIKKVLYPANTMKNVQALRYHHLEHCFINHGESDKAVNQSKFLMAYDKLYIAGPLSERRLHDSGIPVRTGQIKYVGRPQADMSLDIRSEVEKIKTVLYAPTWEGYVEGVNYSSINQEGYKFCHRLLSSGKYKVLFKPHPYTGKVNRKNKIFLEKIKKLFSDHHQEIYGSETSLHELMNKSDVLICDISSVLNEYLVTQKPIVLYKPGCNNEVQFMQDFPSSKAASLIDKNIDVIEILKEIEVDDSLYEARRKIRLESLGEFPEGALARFKKIVEND